MANPPPPPETIDGKIRSPLHRFSARGGGAPGNLDPTEQRVFDLLRAEDRPLRVRWIWQSLEAPYDKVVRALKYLHDFGAAVKLADGSWAADGSAAPTIWPTPHRDPASPTAQRILEAARHRPVHRPEIATLAGESPERWITALTQIDYLTGSIRYGYRLTRAGADAIGISPDEVAAPGDAPGRQQTRTTPPNQDPDDALRRAILQLLKACGPIPEAQLIRDIQAWHPDTPTDHCTRRLQRLRDAGHIVRKRRVGLIGEWTVWALAGNISPVDPAPTFELTLLMGEFNVNGVLSLGRLNERLGQVHAQRLLDSLVVNGFAIDPEDTSETGGAIHLTDHGRAVAFDSKLARALGALRAFPGMTAAQLTLLDILLGHTPGSRVPSRALLDSDLIQRRNDGLYVAAIPQDEGSEPPPDPHPMVTRDLLQAFTQQNLRYSAWLLDRTPRDGSAARFRDIAEGYPSVVKLWRMARRLEENGLVEIEIDTDQGAFIARTEQLTRRNIGSLLGKPAPAARQLELDDLYTLLLIEQMPSAPADDLIQAGFFIGRVTGSARSLRRLEQRGHVAPAGNGYDTTDQGQEVISTIAPALGPGGVRSAARTVLSPE